MNDFQNYNEILNFVKYMSTKIENQETYAEVTNYKLDNFYQELEDLNPTLDLSCKHII